MAPVALFAGRSALIAGLAADAAMMRYILRSVGIRTALRQILRLRAGAARSAPCHRAMRA